MSRFHHLRSPLSGLHYCVELIFSRQNALAWKVQTERTSSLTVTSPLAANLLSHPHSVLSLATLLYRCLRCTRRLKKTRRASRNLWYTLRNLQGTAGIFSLSPVGTAVTGPRGFLFERPQQRSCYDYQRRKDVVDKSGGRVKIRSYCPALSTIRRRQGTAREAGYRGDRHHASRFVSTKSPISPTSTYLQQFCKAKKTS